MRPDLALALSLADDADAITLPRFRAHDLHVETKPDLTPVSEADRAAEAALRERLARERPGELSSARRKGATTDGWILDPIDGTRNYTRGIPVWATMIVFADRIAYISAGTGTSMVGQRGHGAYRTASRSMFRAIDRSRTRRYSTGPGRTGARVGAWHVRGFGDFWAHMLVAEGAAGCRRRAGARDLGWAPL